MPTTDTAARPPRPGQANSTTGVPVTRTTSKSARALARARREALYADRAARDRRIEDGTAAAIAGLAAHTKLTHAESQLIADIGRTLNALAAEGLSRADIAQLTDLPDAQIRRYQAAADTTIHPSPASGATGDEPKATTTLEEEQ